MRNTLNASACAALLDAVNWGDPQLLLSLSILALINVMVIVGNCLVIAAVFCSSKLRSVTNLFIVSLAVADLLVGVAVLPFSATWEVFKVWIFGDVWCNMWLALDVWMCTASILNLCAISLDRYVAVTRPITYPSIMSPSRAKLLIAGLWVLSFVICFPPLVGWKETERRCPWKCELTNEAGYVVYSALGSFYIPMFVMLFFYWRIYRAAIRTTRAINQGFRTTKGSRGFGNRFDEQRLTLRIHRGRGSSDKHHPHGSPHSNGSNSTTTSSVSPSPSTRGRHERVKISVSYPSSENLSPNPNLLAAPVSPTQFAVHYSVNGKDNTTTTSALYKRENQLRVQRLSSRRRASRRSSSCERAPSPSPSACEEGRKVMSRRMGKRNIKAQVKRFRMETKAAKTLAIIVGGFIFCWLPFFTMYLVRAFCPDCIPPLLFSILFWLGYCNSAINPLIYALFSKDFRFAFKRIICKCFCKGRDGGPRRGSDGSQLQGRQFRSPSYNVQQQGNSLGDDSDPGADPSDSR
ncbi:octopamine receptor Oamb [Tribolium madens]|uniref:octopamine receptor Oamb n=1 Tax=Tribolium madens TaxID=41895 RepID=UPI001CF7499A|nr:octopamine receptor Oamb [Tribolium madens]XP_044271459.1 octopamine receptor Oamb [Tribolium madens]